MASARSPWRIVLVRPRNPLNIGAAARAMANFGFDDLVLVAPYDPVWKESRSAVGAGHVIKSARATNSLVEALADRTLVVGTTTGKRRNLDRDLISLRDFPAWLARHRNSAPAALLFGSEKTGLSNEALSYCHALVRIPTTHQSPSMNLGQAVALCCYELARSGKAATSPASSGAHHSEPADLQALDHLLLRLVDVLDASGYFTPKAREAQLLKLRRLVFDLRLTSRNARLLGGVIAQIEWRLKTPKPSA
jgi:TrmH family RNA methyltransferase